MVLITKWMGFAWVKHPSRACPSLEPDGHALIKTNHPRGDEKFCHIFLALRNHLTYLPKLIAICWGWIRCVWKLMCDLIKPMLVHDVVEWVGVGFGLMVQLQHMAMRNWRPRYCRNLPFSSKQPPLTIIALDVAFMQQSNSQVAGNSIKKFQTTTFQQASNHSQMMHLSSSAQLPPSH